MPWRDLRRRQIDGQATSEAVAQHERGAEKHSRQRGHGEGALRCAVGGPLPLRAADTDSLWDHE
jgi:hypothetical protein